MMAGNELVGRGYVQPVEGVGAHRSIGGELVMGSGGEPAMLVVRNAVMRYHGEDRTRDASNRGRHRTRVDRRSREDHKGIRIV